jgi:hypothetical protein
VQNNKTKTTIILFISFIFFAYLHCSPLISGQTKGKGIETSLPFYTDSLIINNKTNAMKKSIYIWSDAELKYSAKYILDYLKLNKITTAILSIRKDHGNSKEANELLKAFLINGIRSEILIGNNKLLEDDKPAEFYNKLLDGVDMKTVAAIHLDVEPHTMKDWKENKEKLLKKYVDLIKSSKAWCATKGIQLSVSIPLHYPDEVLEQIYANVNTVYLMAYENVKASAIVRRTKRAFGIDASKTIIALRAKDFKKKDDFEKLVLDLSKKINTTEFAMHDFETFVKLDEASGVTIK